MHEIKTNFVSLIKRQWLFLLRQHSPLFLFLFFYSVIARTRDTFRIMPEVLCVQFFRLFTMQFTVKFEFSQQFRVSAVNLFYLNVLRRPFLCSSSSYSPDLLTIYSLVILLSFKIILKQNWAHYKKRTYSELCKSHTHTFPMHVFLWIYFTLSLLDSRHIVMDSYERWNHKYQYLNLCMSQTHFFNEFGFF